MRHPASITQKVIAWARAQLAQGSPAEWPSEAMVRATQIYQPMEIHSLGAKQVALWDMESVVQRKGKHFL